MAMGAMSLLLRTNLILAACFACVACSACGHRPAPGESIDEVCKVEKNKTEVSVSGYLVAPILMLECEKSCALYLAREPATREGIFVHFPVGKGPNTMAPIRMKKDLGAPISGEVQQLHAGDFKLTTETGRVISLGAVARLTGKISTYEHDGKIDCSMQHPSVQERE